MKKQSFLFIIALVFIGFTASSQGSSAYLRAGINLANVSITDDGAIEESNMLPSFQIGVVGDLPIAPLLAIQPGLIFTGKGSKVQDGKPSDNNYYRSEVNPFYIEIPVNLVFKAPVNTQTNFFVGAGPYVAMGIAGNRKLDYKVAGIGFNRTDRIDFSNDDPTTRGEEGAGLGILKRFDYGLNGTVGFSGRAASFSLNYGLGLAKLQSGTTNNQDNNNKHRVLSFTVGFRL